MGRKRVFTLDEHYFDKIDSEEKAYFLGYLFADGHNSITKGTIRLRLAEKDESILVKFKSIINCGVPLKRKIVKIKTHTVNEVGLYLYSIHMCRILESYGMTQQKSFTLEFPKKVKKKWLGHFIRGYFDGDGSVHIDPRGNLNISICSSKRFLDGLNEILQPVIGWQVNLSKHRKSDVYYLEYSGNLCCINFYNYVYKNATIFLDRKRIRFIEILNKNITGTWSTSKRIKQRQLVEAK